MGPEEMREHFQKLIRNHHQQRLLQRQMLEQDLQFQPDQQNQKTRKMHLK